MKRILVFGDSNTWGLKPLESLQSTAVRYDENTRWTALLQKYLADEAKILECGLNGRNTGIDDEERGYRLNLNGAKSLAEIVESSNPLDLIIIMLGTNDCRLRYEGMTAEKSASNIDELIKISLSNVVFGSTPSILVISPVPLKDEPLNEVNRTINVAMSHEFSPLFEAVCSKYDNVFFVDAKNAVENADGCDGIHLSEEGHKALSLLVLESVKDIIDNDEDFED